jgi:integrative and conjugative element protein (TIGR02256 family)
VLRENVIEYRVGRSSQVLIFNEGVIEHFRWYRQLRWYHREAGGQLFARFNDCYILIEEATGPRRTDRRTRTSYVPNRRAEQIEIFDRHRRGLHYVGDWHTHPEEFPRPSFLDDASIAECVKKSHHVLNGFVLVIVGQAEPPTGLHASLHDGTAAFTLVRMSPV